MREHFQENDYFSDLTYRRDDRPVDMEMAKEHFRKFIREVRREYRKRGCELKWMRNIEVGTKNGWHIHLIINRIPDTDIILKEAWPHGKVINDLMYEKGSFAELASYITKTPIPKGYYLDKSSLQEGINPYTGYRYRSYSLLPLQDGGKKGGKRIGRQATG